MTSGAATPDAADRRARRLGLVLPVVVLVLAAGFAAASPTFRTAANLEHVLSNNFALPALVSLGMTLAVASGGIDLSVGIAADVAAMVSVMLLASGHGLALALLGGLGGALLVGVADALLITRLRISPFLATLGVLFIGQSVQQLATNGGTPIYLVSGFPAGSLDALARGTVAAIPVPLLIVAAAALGVEVLLGRSVYGRRVRAIGAGQSVARYSGLPIGRTIATTFVLSALLAGAAGILLAATVRSYVPMSGNGFLLDAIGAVFVGTTLDRNGRANVVGTLLGVFLFGMLHNGLLLIGWSFTWQQVAIGLLVLAVLAASFGARSRRRVA